MAFLTRTFTHLLGIVVVGCSTTAMADTYQHIDQLALSIAQQSNSLVVESRHYRHTPEYRHLVSDAREMARLADHLHEVAHHHGSISHMQSDLQELDRSFHHLDAVFQRIEHDARRGHGHIHGDTCHVRQLLDAIEDNIHHLQDDLRSLCPTSSLNRPNVFPSAASNPFFPNGMPQAFPQTNPYIQQRPSIYSVPFPSPWGGARGYHSGHGRSGGHSGHDSFRPSSGGLGITLGGGNARFSIRF